MSRRNTFAILSTRYIPIPESGCWIWERCTNSHGYGILYVNNRQMVAHKYFYEQLIGSVPEGLQLDHLCRVRCCVNPAHLEIVTSRENTLRGVTLPAKNAIKTHCKRGHPFDEFNTGYYPHRGRMARHCRQCNLDRGRKRAC